MGIEKRLDMLEHAAGGGIAERQTIVVVVGGLQWDGDTTTLAAAQKAHKEEARVKVAAAESAFRSEHPDFTGEILIITVVDEETRALTERVIAGDGPSHE